MSFSTATSTTTEASTLVSVQVVFSVAAVADVSIPYSVGGSADSADATVPAGPLVILAGQTVGSIDIQVNDDALSEGREHLTLNLGTPTSGTLGAITSHELTIDDDEAPATIAFDLATASAAEGADEITHSFGSHNITSQRGGLPCFRHCGAAPGDPTN